jgi:hypothetical protein
LGWSATTLMGLARFASSLFDLCPLGIEPVEVTIE